MRIRFAVIAVFSLVAVVLAGACDKPAANKAMPTSPMGIQDPPPKPDDQPVADARIMDDDKKCTTDAECVLATTDCCGCSGLGTQSGVRKDHVAMLTKRRQPVCSVIACAQGMSDDATCNAQKAVCQAGVCVPDVGAAATKKTKVEPIKDE